MRHHPDAVMLFAAGFGTRMGALTATTPKPLIKVAGRPLIDHALDLTDWGCGLSPTPTTCPTSWRRTLPPRA